MAIDKQQFSIELPNGTTVRPVDGSTTLDEAWSPFVQASTTIALPASLVPFDVRSTPAPRVLITAQQDFTDADEVSAFTALFGAGTVAGLTAAYGGGTVADITAAHNRPWTPGETRRQVLRTFDLTLRSRSRGAGNTLVLELASDEALLQDFAPVMGAPYNDEGPIGGGVVPATSLSDVVRTVVSAVLTDATFADFTIDGDVSAFVSGPWSPGPTPYGIPWDAGVSAWDLLAPMVEAAGARLWCDESRKWHLDPAGPDSAVSVAITATGTMTDYTDEISRDADWGDAVVVRYSWTTRAGVQSMSTDYAIPPYPVNWSRTVVFDRPLGTQANSFVPPTGAAAALLAQISVLGRQLPLAAVNDFTTTPGASLTATLPDGTVLTGRVASVAWNFGSRQMRLSTRNMS